MKREPGHFLGSTRPLQVMLVGVALSLGPPARGQDARVQQARNLAAQCAQCHGADGRPEAGSVMPRIAGTPRDEAIRTLNAFRSGARSATVMHQIAKGLTDKQIEMLADYFAAQPR